MNLSVVGGMIIVVSVRCMFTSVGSKRVSRGMLISLIPHEVWE